MFSPVPPHGTGGLTTIHIFAQWKYAETQTYNRFSKRFFWGNNRGRGG
jgi:hypothetical protein